MGFNSGFNGLNGFILKYQRTAPTLAMYVLDIKANEIPVCTRRYTSQISAGITKVDLLHSNAKYEHLQFL